MNVHSDSIYVPKPCGWYRCYAVESPALYYKSTPAAKAVIERWQPAQYYPTFWALSPHVQIIAKLIMDKLVPPPKLQVRSIEVVFDDGERGLLHFYSPPNSPANAPTVLLLPGIRGSVDSNWSFMNAAAERGWKCATFDRRGHCGPLQQSPVFNIMSF